MKNNILNQLKQITQEEQAILEGRTSVERTLYMHDQGNTINSKKLLRAGKLITIRTHTRFIYFPAHQHDYVEMVYMCSGTTTHIVNGNTIVLKQGDLLFINQSAVHEVYEAGIDDIAVNFIVLPAFFSTPLAFMREEKSPLRHFLDDCLCGESSGCGYLHFEVSEVRQIQNLVEILLVTLTTDPYDKRTMSQLTMALLFMQLLEETEKLSTINLEETTIWSVLRYIEDEYIHGDFSKLCNLLHCDPSTLSREIKQKTGKTFTQLLQEKRLTQATYLLKNTKLKINVIARSVGYENTAYFYRIFAKSFGKTPKDYRNEAQCKREYHL